MEFELYKQRKIEFSGVFPTQKVDFKCYRVAFAGKTFTRNDKDLLKQKCLQTLNVYGPLSQYDADCGYCIHHKGRNSNYIIVAHWVQENMLHLRAYASNLRAPDEYIEVTQTGISICVWDMLLHNHERNAYVQHVLLHPASPSSINYLNDTYHA